MMRLVVLGLCATTALPSAARPQHAARDSAANRMAAHTLLGWYAPRSTLKASIDPGVLIGGQVAYRLRRIALVTGLSVTQSDDNRTRADQPDPLLLLLQLDVGVEADASLATPALRGFVGAGIGGRSYRFATAPRPAVAAGYLAVGAEWRFRQNGLRAEARNYFAGAIAAADPGVQQDLQLLVGLGYHFR